MTKCCGGSDGLSCPVSTWLFLLFFFQSQGQNIQEGPLATSSLCIGPNGHHGFLAVFFVCFTCVAKKRVLMSLLSFNVSRGLKTRADASGLMVFAQGWSQSSWLKWLWKRCVMSSSLALEGNVYSGSYGRNPRWKALSKQNENTDEGPEGKSWASPQFRSQCPSLAVVHCSHSKQPMLVLPVEVRISASLLLNTPVTWMRLSCFKAPYALDRSALGETKIKFWTFSPKINGSVEVSLQGDSGFRVVRKEVWEKKWSRGSCQRWICGDGLKNSDT